VRAGGGDGCVGVDVRVPRCGEGMGTRAKPGMGDCVRDCRVTGEIPCPSALGPASYAEYEHAQDRPALQRVTDRLTDCTEELTVTTPQQTQRQTRRRQRRRQAIDRSI
jgi:hypothetical protein